MGTHTGTQNPRSTGTYPTNIPRNSLGATGHHISKVLAMKGHGPVQTSVRVAYTLLMICCILYIYSVFNDSKVLAKPIVANRAGSYLWTCLVNGEITILTGLYPAGARPYNSCYVRYPGSLPLDDFYMAPWSNYDFYVTVQGIANNLGRGVHSNYTNDARAVSDNGSAYVRVAKLQFQYVAGNWLRECPISIIPTAAPANHNYHIPGYTQNAVFNFGPIPGGDPLTFEEIVQEQHVRLLLLYKDTIDGKEAVHVRYARNPATAIFNQLGPWTTCPEVAIGFECRPNDLGFPVYTLTALGRVEQSLPSRTCDADIIGVLRHTIPVDPGTGPPPRDDPATRPPLPDGDTAGTTPAATLPNVIVEVNLVNEAPDPVVIPLQAGFNPSLMAPPHQSHQPCHTPANTNPPPRDNQRDSPNLADTP